MKIFLAILAGALLVAGMVIGVWMLLYNVTSKPASDPDKHVFTPTTRDPFLVNEKPKEVVAGNTKDIAAAFLAQVKDASTYTLKNSIVVSTYGLQVWVRDNQGGEALFTHTKADGWKLMTMGGGAISTSSLKTLGIPDDVAEQLVAAEMKGQ